MMDIEREVIILNSAWEMIDGMVNWAMFVKNGNTEPTNLKFETAQHSLFVILLADFLSQIQAFKGDPAPLGLKPAPSNARPSDLTFFSTCGRSALIRNSGKTRRPSGRLSRPSPTEFTAQGVNLFNIGVAADLWVARIRYIKMCGDIAKHNLARLATNVGQLRKLLEGAGHPVSEQEAYLAIENFFDWSHDDIFIYHSSRIAEFLNNIRWSIYDYLQPEFRRSWYPTNPPFYSYRVPPDITEPVAHAMY
jgi:hypothetical protein